MGANKRFAREKAKSTGRINVRKAKLEGSNSHRRTKCRILEDKNKKTIIVSDDAQMMNDVKIVSPEDDNEEEENFLNAIRDSHDDYNTVKISTAAEQLSSTTTYADSVEKYFHVPTLLTKDSQKRGRPSFA